METSSGWYPDPTGRHDYRYWTGVVWSRRVANTDGGLALDQPDVSARNRPRRGAPRTDVEGRLRQQPGTRRRPPRRRHLTAAVALAFAVILLLGGAAGALVLTMDDSDGEAARTAERVDPLVLVLGDYIVTTSNGTVTDEDAACMADRIVAAVGRARLVEVGVDQGADPLATLNREEIQAGLPSAMECLDDATVEAMIAATLSPSVVARLSVEDPSCLVRGWMDGLGRDQLVQLYALWASGASADLPAVLDPVEMQSLARTINECSQPPPP